MPSFPNVSEIAGPPPCTMTGNDALFLKLTHIFKKTSRQRRKRAASAFHHKAIVLHCAFILALPS